LNGLHVIGSEATTGKSAAERSLGPPWERPLAGQLDRLVVESSVLRSNPLGDPFVRPLYVYRSPGVGSQPVPAIYVLQSYSGQLDMWLARKPFEPTAIERLDAMFGGGGCPDAVVVFVDAWTSLGGSQFLNSAATGSYMDYLCDEVVPFIDGRYRTLAGRDHRGVTGHSSGGYGAIACSMLRPDVFGAFASHAGDALFECCYQRDFPLVARTLRDRFDGSVETFLAAVAQADPFDWGRYGTVLSTYACAAAYADAQLPFQIGTGRIVDDIWARWLEHDPVRMASTHAEALRSMRRIYLDAGRSDEYFLDLGAQALAVELDKVGANYSLELFDGRHGGISHRYPGAIRELVVALRAA
jgi:S-formylglutathione hydrolase FrmB